MENCRECGLKIGGAFGCFGHTKDFNIEMLSLPLYGYLPEHLFPWEDVKYFSYGPITTTFSIGDIYPNDWVCSKRFSFEALKPVLRHYFISLSTEKYDYNTRREEEYNFGYFIEITLERVKELIKNGV